MQCTFGETVYQQLRWVIVAVVTSSKAVVWCECDTQTLSTESSLDDDDDDETSSLDSRHRRLASRAGPRSRAETLRRLEEAVVSGSSDIEWDCNELGVTYDQLASYFDNLKESTAWTASQLVYEQLREIHYNGHCEFIYQGSIVNPFTANPVKTLHFAILD